MPEGICEISETEAGEMQRFFFLGCCYKCLVEHKGRNVFIPVTALKKKSIQQMP